MSAEPLRDLRPPYGPAGPTARRPPALRQLLTCSCGSVWFELIGRPNDPPNALHGAVKIELVDRRVVTYLGRPYCLACNRVIDDPIPLDC
jgi:hypothetical protein